MAKLKSFVIVGGGASGVILATQLLKDNDPARRVTLVEKSGVFGRGLAYSTPYDDHLLNVSARGMSAYANQPDHFLHWLARRSILPGDDSPIFAPRRLYGEYLGEIVDGLAQQEPHRFILVKDRVLTVEPKASGVEVKLANGTSLIAHAAILAAGHDVEPANEPLVAVRPGSDADTPLPTDARVLILGTGLSMVDTWLGLQASGHKGPVIALSRRGLLPSPHRPGKPLILDVADVPLGTDLSYFIDWFRDLIRDQEKKGGNWRDVVDGLRPFNQRIWQSWPVYARRRFLEHTKAWWDIHRHRMAPRIHDRLLAGIESGKLELTAGRLLEATPSAGGYVVRIQPRHQSTANELVVDRIYDCTGIVKDLASGSLSVVRSLIDHGFARNDPLRVGLDVTTDCAVIDSSGGVSDRIFAIGPLTRGTFFEIDAVPEIRTQATRLAARLTT